MIGERLDRVEVTQPDGSTAAVGGLGNRSATILLARHDDCDRCRELRTAADERSDKIGWWGARTVVTDADALEESAKFLGTQCPECGVPDRPDTGGWAVV